LVELGRINKLTVLTINPDGVALGQAEADRAEDIYLPPNEIPNDCKVGDEIEAFIYLDSKNNRVATTKKVDAQVGEVAFLKVVEVNNVGAFLDWGLPKDLLVPFNQQRTKLLLGKSYLVYVYLDERTNRLAASTKLNKFISNSAHTYKKNQAVELAIWEKTDLGYSTVINNKHWGLLYYGDVRKQLTTGQRLNGYIKNVRNDGKINLSLQPVGHANIDPLAAKIQQQLEENNGFIPLSDKSPPELIFKHFGVSKKAFKMSVGSLFKKRLITISPEGISLVSKS